MGFIATLNQGLDILLRPLLDSLAPFWTLVVICIGLTLFMTVIYKYTTNQSLMKDLKDELKAFQAQMKELRSEPDKMMEVQKKAMETNMKYMMHSMRSTLFTFIPIIIIFAWLNASLAFEPIMPGQDFTTTVEFERGVNGLITLEAPTGVDLLSEQAVEVTDGKAIWKLRAASEGTYFLDYTFDEKIYTKEVLVSSEQKYAEVTKSIRDDRLDSISIDHEPLKFSILGLRMGWIWVYIIVSVIFSMLFRKLFKVY